MIHILPRGEPVDLYFHTLVTIRYLDPAQGPYTLGDSKNSRFILSGQSQLRTPNLSVAGKYAACIAGELTVDGSAALVIDLPGYRAAEDRVAFLPFENQLGNLSYIDGCSNSNLIDPARNGHPCVNYLYFPPDTVQTFHTHPSVRVGIVLSGEGEAVISGGKSETLKPGVAFMLERHTKHRFVTGGHNMSLLVFHPDSEDGPRDEANPMKTRTYLEQR